MAITSIAQTRFSVVLPVKNTRSFLPELVERLQRLEEPPGGFEVILVDDRSTDGSRELMAGLVAGDGRFRVISGPGLGPESARNAGVAVAQGRYIAFTDDDTLPEPNWLVVAAQALDSSGARALEGAILPWGQPRPSWGLSRMPVNQDGGRYMTANMVYERDLFYSVGGLASSFDQTFGIPHFLGDADLAFRVKDRGVEIPYVPQMQVRHRVIPLRLRSFLRDQAKLHWVPLFARRHPQRYREEIKPKVQRLRPGDTDFVVALPLLVAARNSSPAVKLLAGAFFLLTARRVTSALDLSRVPLRERPVWLGASLVAPLIRVGSLALGWARFRKLSV